MQGRSPDLLWGVEARRRGKETRWQQRERATQATRAAKEATGTAAVCSGGDASELVCVSLFSPPSRCTSPLAPPPALPDCPLLPAPSAFKGAHHPPTPSRLLFCPATPSETCIQTKASSQRQLRKLSSSPSSAFLLSDQSPFSLLPFPLSSNRLQFPPSIVSLRANTHLEHRVQS